LIREKHLILVIHHQILIDYHYYAAKLQPLKML